MNTLLGSNFCYLVTIHIDSIPMTPNSIGQTKYLSYLVVEHYPRNKGQIPLLIWYREREISLRKKVLALWLKKTLFQELMKFLAK